MSFANFQNRNPLSYYIYNKQLRETSNIIIYQVSKFIHSSILLVKRGSRESHEIQLLTA